jgi:long-subunit acyl-CoA synthetase (AMP-forming)
MQLAGKRVAILAESRPEWVTAYMAAFCTGSVVIPLDKELLEDQIRNFIELSEADVLFYSEAYSNIVKSMSESLPGVKYYICFDGVSGCDGEKFKSYRDVLATVRSCWLKATPLMQGRVSIPRS